VSAASSGYVWFGKPRSLAWFHAQFDAPASGSVTTVSQKKTPAGITDGRFL
jgi:hypothetical protein